MRWSDLNDYPVSKSYIFYLVNSFIFGQMFEGTAKKKNTFFLSIIKNK